MSGNESRLVAVGGEGVSWADRMTANRPACRGVNYAN